MRAVRLAHLCLWIGWVSLWLVACGGGSETVSSLELEAGVCFNSQSDGAGVEISAVEAIDCTQPHNSEVFHIAAYPAEAGVDFPGEQILITFAEERCKPAFLEYVGVDYNSSLLEIRPLLPSAASWRDGDREVVCILTDPNSAQMNESKRGSAE